MYRAWLVLAVLTAGLARGAAPTYSADNIVNGANFQPGPFAPNSLVTIFGEDLSFDTESLTEGSNSTRLPEVLANSRVYVANLAAGLIYVSPTQINFVVPSDLLAGDVPVRVVRQGWTGPEVTIVLTDAAPQFFQSAKGDIVAQHVDYSLVTRESPAGPGEVVILYATGLGRTKPFYPDPSEIPARASKIANPMLLFLGGGVVDPERIWYAGLTPGSAGVYQINVQLPDEMEPACEVQALISGQLSAAGVMLPTTMDSPQPEPASLR
jgi:uncharacterized protein (TIGR03437 family)